jgi:PAS domain S-box-containing protein
MKLFRDIPIQRKMLVMSLLICGAVLCVAIATLFAFQVLNFRSNFRHDATTVAMIIAKNSTAALAFKDDKAATELVSSLEAKPSVIAATLVFPDGSSFAHYGPAETSKTLSTFPPAGEYRFIEGHLLLAQKVVLQKEHVGTLFLRSNYRQTFLKLLGFYALVIAGVLIVSIILAVFLSGRLGRTITNPILHLAQTAQVVGELKDYSVRATVRDSGDEVGRLTESFNEMLGRIETQDAELSRSQQKMEALIHSIDGIVWECTPDTFRFTFVSRQSEDILGYDPVAWLAQPNFWEEKLQRQDAGKAVQTRREMAGRCQPYSYEYRMTAADGRTVWIRESGTVLVEKGQPVAMRGIFQDITRQKQDAEQLDKLNRQLMDTSRNAGMAEVATGVLHNVGNILNSVSVSATVVSDRLRNSNVGDLCRATTMMQKQNGRLAEFLTADPKGKLIPDYLGSVAEELANEQAELITEMNSVGQNIEHIKEIVAMQQNYAKLSGVYEWLTIPELVEDALRMNTAAFDRHHIELYREFDENTPRVCVDRHKVLQILINLLRNAKHAMEGRTAVEKKMVIQVGLASADQVKIVVRDNGVGIPPDHLTKIFNHGFTTKKGGHGFGLHSGANAAREMGGSLTARSDGPGKGAEFTLILPTAAPSRKEEAPATTAKI